MDFSKLFSKYRTVSGMMDVYESYELLSRNHFLKRNFKFIEILVNSEKYFQMKYSRVSNGRDYPLINYSVFCYPHQPYSALPVY